MPTQIQKHILIVDDEEDIREILTFNLEAEGYRISSAHSAEDGASQLSKDIDLILLDVMMPGISGFRWAEQLRKQGQFDKPIIFLTARDTENDLLTGFSLGADDYISKPFSIKELTARIRAVLARAAILHPAQGESSSGREIIFGPLVLDQESKTVSYDGQLLPLTKKELEILSLLAAEPNRVFERTEILDRLWPEDVFVMERTVDVHIARLRKKLGPGAVRLINRSGFGYCLTLQDKEG